MEVKLKIKRLITTLFMIVFILLVHSELIAQENTSNCLKDFKIVVEKTDNGIKLQSFEGSDWVNLTFSINDYQQQAIDEFGMTELNKITSEKDANLADFLFTIMKTENGIALSGIEGTAWTDLSFLISENGKQAIDQLGMTKLN